MRYFAKTKFGDMVPLTGEITFDNFTTTSDADILGYNVDTMTIRNDEPLTFTGTISREFYDLLLTGGKQSTKNTYDEYIKDVIYSGACTIVLWKDGTKTIVRCQDEDDFDHEKGLAMAFCKKVLGNNGNYYDMFKKYAKETTPLVKRLSKIEGKSRKKKK